MEFENRSLRWLAHELFANPFWFILFFTEGVKETVHADYYTAAIFFGLAVFAGVVWVLSDAIKINWDAIIGERPEDDE